MRAVQLHAVGADPTVVEVVVPEPGPGQVRVAMRACGICGSDLHVIEGSTAAGRLPLTLGHEPSGVVDAVGPGVEQPSVGDRVVVSSVIYCGECAACGRGATNLCSGLTLLGVQTDGAHADFFLAPAVNCVPLPSTVDFAAGAVVTDAVATPLHAIRRGRIGRGETVAVFGVGGLGCHAVMLLKQLFGATVIAIDVHEAALERALRLGADVAVDGREGKIGRRVAALADGGVDLALDFVGSPQVIDGCLRSLRPGGRCVAVGVTPERLALSVRQETLVAREIELLGSFGFLRSEIAELLGLLELGQLDLGPGISHLFPLENYAAGLDVLRDRGANPARVVITNGV